MVDTVRRLEDGASTMAQSAHADDNLDYGIFLPDIAKETGLSIEVLAEEIRTRRMNAFEGSDEDGAPIKMWSVDPVGLAGWLARQDTPIELRAPLRTFFERTLAPEHQETAFQQAAKDAIMETADNGLPVSVLADRLGVPEKLLLDEVDAQRLDIADAFDYPRDLDEPAVSPTGAMMWLAQPDGPPELREPLQAWVNSFPSDVQAQASEWAKHRAEDWGKMKRMKRQRALAPNGPEITRAVPDPKVAEARRQAQKAQKQARKKNRRR
jgi:hypothetical protein